MRDRLLTIGKTSEMLGVSRQTIYKYVKEGDLKSVLLPDGRKRVVLSDLQAFIRSLKRASIKKPQDELDWSLDFVSKYNRFPSFDELQRRKKLEE